MGKCWSEGWHGEEMFHFMHITTIFCTADLARIRKI